MGSKPWRNLGVLALAGASLVGCTTPQTTKLVAPTPQTNSWNTPAGQVPPPNQGVFNQQQQFAPNANGGSDNQQRQTVQGGFPQTGGPTNPNNNFNTSNGAQNFNGNAPSAQNFPPPSNPTNSYITATPNGNLQQPYNNPGFQGNTNNPAAQNPYAGGPAPSGVPPMPSFPPPPGGSVAPIPPPTGFGTGR